MPFILSGFVNLPVMIILMHISFLLLKPYNFPHITCLCFLSFEFGIFPECLKIDEVIRIIRIECKMEVNNYRPISILFHFSKIFENFIVALLTNFLEKKKILHGNHYGFRPKLGTTNAMLDIINGIR